MTPAVRRLLREHGLAAAQIVGTGGGGRITRDDVLDVVETIRTGGARAGAAVTAAPAAAAVGAAAPARPPPRPPPTAAGRADRVPGRRGRGPRCR